ncbi:MAG: heavy metal translocating P-type ATPase [Tissierellia bacterium]|nr:heavy metal translocating P-type ATPase [Tissierellia bacterium]
MKLKIYGLNCAHCAGKISDKVGKMPEVKKCELDYINENFFIDFAEEFDLNIMNKIRQIIDSIEDGVTLSLPEESLIHLNENTHDDCACCEFEYDSSHDLAHDHDHGEEDLKTFAIESIIAIGLLIFGHFFAPTENIKTIVGVLAYIVSGRNIAIRGIKQIPKIRNLDENLLMTIATAGALILGEYPEASGVMLLYRLGEYLQHRSVDKSKDEIKLLLDLKVDYANIKKGNEFIKIETERVMPGDILLVRKGESIPVDGKLDSEIAVLNMQNLTGESLPVNRYKGQNLSAGSINDGDPIILIATKKFSDSATAKIMEIVEHSAAAKAKSEKFISRFARVYTPAVVIFAFIVGAILPIILKVPFRPMVEKALTFLLVSCPCALVISVPMAFIAGMGDSSRKGVLIKGGNYLEELSKTDTVIFDKTGTVTSGEFEMTEFKAFTEDKSELLKAVASGERFSDHPLARAIMKNYNGDFYNIDDFKEYSGMGIEFEIGQKHYLIGNERLLEQKNIKAENERGIHIVVNSKYEGYMIFEDLPKESSLKAVQSLNNMGINTIIASGDSEHAVNLVANELGIREHYSQLMPEDKVDIVKKLRNEHTTVFVGDGVNDAPSIAIADVGIAMGALGSDSAIEIADCVIMGDDLNKLPDTIKTAKMTMRKVKQNIAMSLGIKFGIMLFTLFVVPNMWLAIFGDIGVSLIAVVNSATIMMKR